MRQHFFALLLGLSICAYPLQAQTASSANPDYNKQFYVFASPGVVKRPDGQAFALAIGAGVERFLFQRVTVGFEFADSVTHDTFISWLTHKPEKGASRVAWGALNGAYNFRRKDSPHQMRPFLTAGCGLSAVNGAGVGTQVNYGAGFNHWHSQHLGVRVEVRRFLHSGDSEGRFTGLRIGLAIR